MKKEKKEKKVLKFCERNIILFLIIIFLFKIIKPITSSHQFFFICYNHIFTSIFFVCFICFCEKFAYKYLYPLFMYKIPHNTLSSQVKIMIKYAACVHHEIWFCLIIFHSYYFVSSSFSFFRWAAIHALIQILIFNSIF